MSSAFPAALLAKHWKKAHKKGEELPPKVYTIPKESSLPWWNAGTSKVIRWNGWISSRWAQKYPKVNEMVKKDTSVVKLLAWVNQLLSGTMSLYLHTRGHHKQTLLLKLYTQWWWLLAHYSRTEFSAPNYLCRSLVYVTGYRKIRHNTAKKFFWVIYCTSKHNF